MGCVLEGGFDEIVGEERGDFSGNLFLGYGFAASRFSRFFPGLWTNESSIAWGTYIFFEGVVTARIPH